MLYNFIMVKRILAKARAVGGSLVVTIPREVVEAEDIRKDELVEIGIEKHKKSFFGAVKDIGPFTKKDKWKFHD